MIAKILEKKNKKHIGFTLIEESSEKWKIFAKENNFSTLSKLIREAVDFYIESNPLITVVDNITKFFQNLKEPLTSIKGFSHILLENYRSELDFEILLKIKNIYDQSIILEKYINESLLQRKGEEKEFDILIIDNDRSTVKLLINFFEGKGYTCKEVSRGLDATKLLQKSTPKLILLDILLPDIDGYKICDMIKSDDRLKDIPVYYITALNKAEIDMFKNLKADGVFFKPFDLRDFNFLFDLL